MLAGWCSAEADELPGIVADRYNDVVVVQLLTQGTAQGDVREVVTGVIREQLGGSAGYGGGEAGCAGAGAGGAWGQVLGTGCFGRIGAEAKLANSVHDQWAAGLRMTPERGRRRGRFWISGSTMKLRLGMCEGAGAGCLHIPGWICAAFGRCGGSRVRAGDGGGCEPGGAGGGGWESGAKPGAERAKVDWVEADAFELLRDWEGAGRKFGTVVLDPPAFAKSKRAAEGAARGYREMNLRALKMLEPGGTLVTCSCSQHVGLEEFMGVVAGAAADARSGGCRCWRCGGRLRIIRRCWGWRRRLI